MTGKAAERELRNEAETPDTVFETLNEEYGFGIDVCASAENHKLREYWTKEDDALVRPWHGRRVWCNPPYADIEPWLAHAHEPRFAAYLLPARTFNVWWAKYAPKAEIHWFIGRMRFKPPNGVKYSSCPFPVCLLLFGQGCTPGLQAFRDAKTGRRIYEVR